MEANQSKDKPFFETIEELDQILKDTNEPEIMDPDPKETLVLAVQGNLHWKTVAYTIAAFNRKVGNPLAGESFRTDHVFGRCLGERSDGKTFFATTILPWIWDEGYEWKMIARARLDSFLFPECACDAREEETKVCQHHLELMQEWEYVDRRNMRTEEAKTGPKAEEGAGVFATSKPMNLDYPWARITSDGRQICTICGYGRGEYGAIGNPTYRNIFIRDHSHCGFGDASRYAPSKPERRDTDCPMYVIPKTSMDALAAQEFRPGQAMAAVAAIQVVNAPQPAFHRAEAVCKNCKRGIFQNGEWWHLTLFRACGIDGLTVAQP